MTSDGQKILLRYWGSNFKTPQMVEYWTKMLRVAVNRGWRCYLVISHAPQNASWLDSIRNAGIELVYLPRARRHFDPACVRAVYSLCRSLKVDCLHCENSFVSPLLGAFLAGVPVRFWTKQLMQEHYAECRPATFREKVAISTRTGCALATRIVAVSKAVKQEIVAMGANEQRVIVRHLPRFTLGGGLHDRNVLRKSLGYSPSDIVVMTVGHAAPVKGWDNLLRSFEHIHAKNSRARLLVVGSTSSPTEREYFVELKSSADQRGSAKAVIFTGYVDDLLSYLRAADVFVLPSRSEACSFALLEAMQAGLPCVATRVGAAEQTVDHGVNGFLVERNDSQALAEKLQMLVDDAGLRSRFAHAARVPDSFPTIEGFGEQLCCLYESFLLQDGERINRVSHASA